MHLDIHLGVRLLDLDKQHQHWCVHTQKRQIVSHAEYQTGGSQKLVLTPGSYFVYIIELQTLGSQP